MSCGMNDSGSARISGLESPTSFILTMIVEGRPA